VPWHGLLNSQVCCVSHVGAATHAFRQNLLVQPTTRLCVLLLLLLLLLVVPQLHPVQSGGTDAPRLLTICNQDEQYDTRLHHGTAATRSQGHAIGDKTNTTV
jgi:hypothetical protein